MTQEDYVSFETAKLLKEKGFSELTTKAYPYFENKNYKYDISCPTLQMAMKWLRKSHNLYIESYVIKNYNNKKMEYTYSIQDLDFNGSDDGIECCKNWNSPEEACEAAIKYCLEKLI